MDSNAFDALKNNNPELIKGRRIDYVVRGFEQYASDGTPFHAQLWDEDDFDRVVQLLDIEKISGKKVIAHHVENTVSSDERDSQERGEGQLFKSTADIKDVLSFIADTQNIWEEEPNDYRATFLLKYDNDTVLAIGEESMDVSEGSHFEVSKKYWVAVMGANDVDNYASWRHWDLTFFDTKAYQAEIDALEIEREKAEGATNLSRLKEGDVLRVIAKRREFAPYDTLRLSRYSQAELDERFTQDFVIITPGSEPIVESNLSLGCMRLAGGGNWTTRKQNPVQQLDKMITPSFGYIYPDQHVLFRSLDTPDLDVTDLIVDSCEVIVDE